MLSTRWTFLLPIFCVNRIFAHYWTHTHTHTNLMRYNRNLALIGLGKDFDEFEPFGTPMQPDKMNEKNDVWRFSIYIYKDFYTNCTVRMSILRFSDYFAAKLRVKLWYDQSRVERVRVGLQAHTNFTDLHRSKESWISFPDDMIGYFTFYLFQLLQLRIYLVYGWYSAHIYEYICIYNYVCVCARVCL